MFDLILYVQVKIFLDMLGRVFLGRASTKQGLMCLAQGHNAVTPVRLEPATPRSRVKHSTEPLRSLSVAKIQMHSKKANNKNPDQTAPKVDRSG